MVETVLYLRSFPSAHQLSLASPASPLIQHTHSSYSSFCSTEFSLATLPFLSFLNMKSPVSARLLAPARLCTFLTHPAARSLSTSTRRSFASTPSNLASWGFIGLGRMGELRAFSSRVKASIYRPGLLPHVREEPNLHIGACPLQGTQWQRICVRKYPRAMC